jgi:hypothetical protein
VDFLTVNYFWNTSAILCCLKPIVNRLSKRLPVTISSMQCVKR